MNKRFLGVMVALVVLGFGAGIGIRAWRVADRNRVVPVPTETDVLNVHGSTNQAVNNTNGAPRNTNTTPVVVPAELNLSAPFTTQAPLVNWDAEHEEFCEEASVLMAARALEGRSISSPTDAEAALQQLKKWEVDNLGYFASTTAAETARMVREFYGLSARLLVRPTVAELKSELAQHHFVVIPAAGRELHNPNFKSPGPLYHMLLLKGYTQDDEFVTNDPGTRKGKNYVYSQSVLMNAIHDWNGGDVLNGTPVVIVISAVGT